MHTPRKLRHARVLRLNVPQRVPAEDGGLCSDFSASVAELMINNAFFVRFSPVVKPPVARTWR